MDEQREDDEHSGGPHAEPARHETSPEPRKEAETGADCEACRRGIARFVAGDLGAGERERMRAHLRGCRPCAAAYAEALGSAARLGRSTRDRRLASEARQRRETHRAMALSATGPKRRGPLHGLRLALLPALFALLVILVDRTPSAPRLVWEQGVVEVGGRRLDAELGSVRVGAGTWCKTAEDSAARLEVGGATLRLGGRAVLRVERAAPDDGTGSEARVRLHSGPLAIDGAASVSTPLGVFVLAEDSAGRLVVREGEVEATCERGAVSCTGPRGSERLAAGASRTWSLVAGAPRGEP